MGPANSHLHAFILNAFYLLSLLVLCVCLHVYDYIYECELEDAMACIWMSEDKFPEILSFHVGFWGSNSGREARSVRTLT